MEQANGLPGQSTEQVASRFGVSIPTVRRWRSEGQIIGYRVGREIRFADAEVVRFAQLRFGELLEDNVAS